MDESTIAPARAPAAAARPARATAPARGFATGVGREPSLAEAARDFEALLVQQMLRSASQPMAGPSLLDGGPAGRTYRELFHQELARQAAEGGGFGIARMLVEQLGEREARQP